MTVSVRCLPDGGLAPSPHRPDSDHAAALPVAVAEPIAELVAGPPRAATVLGSHDAAVILTLDGPAGHTRVISVLATEASGVPNGARTTLHAADRPFVHLAPGDAARLGAGRIDLPGLTLRAARTVRTAVPPVDPHPDAVTRIAAAARLAPRGVPDGPVTALAAALAGDNPEALAAAVEGLVGLGTGSTPGGDDVLAGTLAALMATGRNRLTGRIAATALAGIEDRTPVLSADLLRLAVNGHVCAEAAAVMRAAAHPPGRTLDRALTALLRIGHTSGADLATGLGLAWSAGQSLAWSTGLGLAWSAGLGPASAADRPTGPSTTPPEPTAADREERLGIHD